MSPAVAYEMLVSHSPPVFSHSPTSSFLADYPSFRAFDSTYPRSPKSNRRTPNTLPINQKQPTPKMPSPIRPCLVIRPDDTSNSSDEDPQSPTKLKKKVVFADDKGMSLTHVRVMTEPSNVPPVWSFRFLAEVTQGLSAEPGPETEPWEITFPQPASDYVDFRKRLDEGKVSLENVIIKEADEVIIGTVKVSNISYQKEVIVRVSSDNWKTFEDAYCNFVPNSVNSAVNCAYVLFDTFSFKIPLPTKARKIEFCVCYKCNGKEYWDNNNNKNYVIMKKMNLKCKSFSADDIYKRPTYEIGKPTLKSSEKYSDAVHAKLDSWSEFASWNHLETTTPYW